jgi:hypothetical protein
MIATSSACCICIRKALSDGLLKMVIVITSSEVKLIFVIILLLLLLLLLLNTIGERLHFFLKK